MGSFDPRNSYTPLITSPRPSADIEEFYVLLTRDAFDQEPVVDLVRHIRTKYGEERFHALISMRTLIVSGNNPIEFDRETLRIDYHSRENEWQFSYVSKPFKLAEFTRRYAGPLGIEKFDNFVRMIRW